MRSAANSNAAKPAANSRYSGKRRLNVATFARFHLPQGSSSRESCSDRPASEGLYVTTVRSPMWFVSGVSLCLRVLSANAL